jgi:hypothetical protein
VEDRDFSCLLAVLMNQPVFAEGGALGASARLMRWSLSSPSGHGARSAGLGAKGDRHYAWAGPAQRRQRPENRTLALGPAFPGDPWEIPYYICHGPGRIDLAELAQIVGAR